MNKSLGFVGRQNDLRNLQSLYIQRKHMLLVGMRGIGKTALLRQLRQKFPLLICDETSSLRRICDGLERELGWTHRKMNVVERKNRLLPYLRRRGTPVALDHVALTPPRVERFIAHLTESVPVWIACRSDHSKEIGAVWQHLYKFTRVELGPLSLGDTTRMIETAVTAGNVQADSRRHSAELHRIAQGNPRVLDELLIELAAREYAMESSFGLKLLELDRRIHEVTTETAGALGPNHHHLNRLQ
jgi:hypothetical protein